MGAPPGLCRAVSPALLLPTDCAVGQGGVGQRPSRLEAARKGPLQPEKQLLVSGEVAMVGFSIAERSQPRAVGVVLAGRPVGARYLGRALASGPAPSHAGPKPVSPWAAQPLPGAGLAEALHEPHDHHHYHHPQTFLSTPHPPPPST